MSMRLPDAVRASDWWERKLGLAVATGWATAYMLSRSVLDAWPAVALTLAALVPAAAYVSLINDLTDLEQDRVAGKSNRLAGRPMTTAVAAIATCIGGGVAVALIAWRRDPLALALYAGSWISFTLYSCPPIRLKVHGLAGPAADAAGAHAFPALLAVAAVTGQLHRPIDIRWVAIVGTWAWVQGISLILWHQLHDLRADAQAGIDTFARAHEVVAMRMTAFAMPLELALFAALTVFAHDAVAAILFLPYLPLALARMRAPVTTQARVRGIVDEFYMVVYPVAFLCAAAIHHPEAWIVLAVHTALFHGALGRWLRDASRAADMLRQRRAMTTRRRVL